VSSDSLLLSSPTGVESKNATSCLTNCMAAAANVGSSRCQHASTLSHGWSCPVNLESTNATSCLTNCMA
jgi:hypothetical protein